MVYMKIVLSHGSALEYWRSAPARQRACAGATRMQVLPSKAPTRRDAALMLLDAGLDLEVPLHVLVATEARKARVKHLCVHSTSQLPARSLMRIDDDVLTVCPELCFVQMATVLPLAELIRVGYELCGGYADFEGVRFGCEPVTTPAKLRAYLRRAKGVHGVKKARRALGYVLADSASPMETTLAMILSLPYAMGGYSLPAPQLNGRVEPRRQANGLLNQSFYVCDLLWRSAGVAVEYDSTSFHSGAQRMAHDARRRGDLSVLGVTVETATADQVYNWTQLDKLVGRLARLLKVRAKPLEARRFAAQQELRACLLGGFGGDNASPRVRLSDVVRSGFAA